MAVCTRCERSFANAMQLGAHIRSCHFVTLVGDVPVYETSDEDSDSTQPDSTQTAIVTQPAALWELARRNPCYGVDVASPTAAVQDGTRGQYVRDYREVCFCCYSVYFLCLFLCVMRSCKKCG